MDLLEAVNSPLSGVCQRWLSLIKEAKKIKHELFGKYAEESAKFFDSETNFMWDNDYATKQGGYLSEDSFGASGFPTFRMTVNRVFEAVALFGPALYHRNPTIVVQPKLPPMMESVDLGLDENDEMQAQVAAAILSEQNAAQVQKKTIAKLCQHYLNWLQLETGKKVQSRRAINDAIVKGMGLLWIEIYQPPNSTIRYPRSVYMSCDDLVKDPDARYQEDVQWIARRCVHPVNLVEEKYGYKPGTLRANMASLKSQQSKRTRQDLKNGRRDSKSFDLIEYWEIYSKNGFGQHLKENKKKDSPPDLDLSVFGKYCYLAVCEDLPFPLNVPPNLTERRDADEMAAAAAWPIPFWEDDGCNNGWPCVELGFYEAPDHIWPIPLIKPAIGEIRFVNWCMSFLADRTAASCKTYMAVVKQAAEEIKQQLTGQNGPFSLVELSNLTGKSIKEVISFLDAPKFDESIWTMVAQVMELIDKRTGLTELVYGLSGRQMRSAEEARVKNENTTIRPDEMASKVEDWLSDCAMKEIEAAIWAMEYEDYEPVFGKVAARVFAQNVYQPDNFYEQMVRNYTYRVEAGSARKPNKTAKVDQLTQLANFLLPLLQEFAAGGQIEPWNAFILDLCDAMDLDAQRYLLHEPPQVPGEDPQAALQLKQAELDMKMQSEEQKLQMQREKLEMELQGKQMAMELKAQEGQQDLALNQAKFQQESAMQAQEHQQQIAITQASAQQDARLKEQSAQSDLLTTLAKNKMAADESQTKQAAMKTKVAQKPRKPKT